MLFPTTLFAIFFVIVFSLYWGLGRWTMLRKWLLLVASFIFYAVWSWKFALLLMASAVVNHVAACVLERLATRHPHAVRSRRAMMIVAVALNLGMLGVFKYTRFLTVSVLFPVLQPVCDAMGQSEWFIEWFDYMMTFADSIVLPVGISFFTFQALSYVLDVYWRKIAPARSTLDFANYLAFFPQLVAGPIVRAIDLLPQMESLPVAKTARLDVGRAALLILIGLFKKMILANWLSSHLADPVFANPAAYSAGDLLLGIYGYTLQIYCDFSAYSDIAIGVALLLGFHFPINFNAPYFSVTLQEFWRRWHISLSSWLRDYLYIPLGGSRRGAMRTRINLFLTMLLGGLWHGAGWTFILWGAFHGAYLSIERLVRRALGLPEKPSENTPWYLALLGRIWIFHVAAFAWIFFRAVSMADVGTIFCGLTAWRGTTLLSCQAVLVLMMAYAVQWFDGYRLVRFWRMVEKLPAWVLGAIVALVLIGGVLALAPEGVQPFIYFQF